MKHKIALLMSLVLIIVMMAGCGADGKSGFGDYDDAFKELLGAFGEEDEEDLYGESYEDIYDENNEEDEMNEEPETVSSGRMDNVSYVMIYNPNIYVEGDGMNSAEPAYLSTGDISSQIVMNSYKAGELDSNVSNHLPLSQKEINKGVDMTGVNREGVKSGALENPSYSVGDTHAFFCYDESFESAEDIFKCMYNGKHCYIWSLDNSLSNAQAEMMGKDFDSNIYENVVGTFGEARFTDAGGKINLLFYPMQDGLGGFFTRADIFSSAEVTEDVAEIYGFNTDHAIVHINSQYVESEPEYAKSTMAHELQHLICATESLYYSELPWMKTWIDESMSAYAEEVFSPGIKEMYGYNKLFYQSDNYRKGQSLYNFETENDSHIGAYGAAYLFSKYLSGKAGNEVFSNIHSYWRYSASATVTEAEALVNAVPEAVYNEIDKKYTYPDSMMKKYSLQEVWMSKLTLDFYINTLSMDFAGLTGEANTYRLMMLYGEMNPVEIQGGGRIVVATNNGSFEVPADADKELVYIGLDANFNPVQIMAE